jgi:hypothetical protein
MCSSTFVAEAGGDGTAQSIGAAELLVEAALTGATAT